MSYRDTAHNGRRLCVPYHSIRRRPWLVDGIGNGPPISNFLFRAGSPGSVGRHVRRRPLGASIAALMGRHISLPRSSHPPPPRSTTAGSSTRQRVSHSEQTRLPSSLPQYSTYSIFRLVDPRFFFFARRALAAAHYFLQLARRTIIRQIIIHWRRAPSPEYRIFSLPSDPVHLLESSGVPQRRFDRFGGSFVPLDRRRVVSRGAQEHKHSTTARRGRGRRRGHRRGGGVAPLHQRKGRRCGAPHLFAAVLRISGPDISRRNAANMSHGKMTLYKLVVLGDGGVGKTALTIQVSRSRARLDGARDGRLTPCSCV